MTAGATRNPANADLGGWMGRVRRQRSIPTASFSHGSGMNPAATERGRGQRNSALIFDHLLPNSPDHDGVSLAPATAERSRPGAAASTSELKGQVQRDPIARHAEGMPHGDSTAIDVDDVH